MARHKYRTPPTIYASIFKKIKRRELRSKKTDMRGRHTKISRMQKMLALKESLPKSQKCASCAAELDPSFTTDSGDALVCRFCGVVDAMPIFDTDIVPLACLPGSPIYRHRYYFGERVRQAKNQEPRFSDEETDMLSMVHNMYQSSGSLFWNESFFTKKHMSLICTHLVKRFPRSFWTRRCERWLQYRTYICGNTGLQLPDHISESLRSLFDAYSIYFQRYGAGTQKRNITQLDLVILILLYSLNPKYVNLYGWYFLNKNLVNKTNSVFSNYEAAKNICNTINEQILNEYDKTITADCYRWFRNGNKLEVPDLEDLVGAALASNLGAIQYANYCKNNSIGSYLFYKKNKSPF